MPSNVYFVRLKNGDPDKTVKEKLNVLVDKSNVLKSVKKEGFTGIKLHFGEEGNTGHIKAAWLAGLIDRLQSITKNIFFTDTNVLYKQSRRTNAVDHLKLAHDHGFTLSKYGVPIIIADGLLGRNFVEVEINKKHFSKVKIA